MIAFIGPNGAGKSTTIKMLTGILYPNKGDIKVLGFDPRTDRKKLAYEIGTVFGQKEQLWTHLTPYDILESVVERKIEELRELFENHLKINNTNLEPTEVADIVIEKFGLNSNIKKIK